MKEKPGAADSAPRNSDPVGPVFRRKNWMGIGVGVALLIIGFVVLTFVDARAENWAGIVSPLLIVGAYIIIGVSIVL